MDDEEEEGREHVRRREKIGFQEDLKKLLFGFGDSKEPKEETIRATEEYLVYFLDKLVENVQEKTGRADGQGNNKLMKEDVLFAVRSDPKWMARLATWLKKNSEISKIKEIKSDPSQMKKLRTGGFN